MAKTRFDYVIYIHGTPAEVWRGLTDPVLTARYWFHENVSDWTPGSTWEHRRADPLGITGMEDGVVDLVGEVLEAEHPHRLVLTWAPPDAPAEDVSTVSFEIASMDDWPMGPWSGLTLTHAGLEEGSEMLQSISFGWPGVLSGLKSILERPALFDI